MADDPVNDYLKGLQTSDRVRDVAWESVYAHREGTISSDELNARLKRLPLSDDARDALWSMAHGEAPQAQAVDAAEPPSSQHQSAPESAVSRFASNLWDTVNPANVVNFVRDSFSGSAGFNQYMAARDQFEKSKQAAQAGETGAAVGHYVAGVVPGVGPAVAEGVEQIASGDVAGGMGRLTGIAAPLGAPAAVRAAGTVARAAARTRTAASVADVAEARAAARVSDVMAPKVGPNKTRFGNKADEIAPRLAKDLAEDGAPLTRDAFHANIQAKLSEAEASLDAAAAARNPKAVVYTKPIVTELRKRASAYTAKTHRLPGMKAGEDVVPAPNRARVEQIQQAIREIEQLGPVANYETLRRIRQAYDGPAKAVYSPSVTADYLKAQGGKLGAADVTGVLREALAKMDPTTAQANAQYSLYRAADDVLSATAEVERTRPRVGRQIIARMTGTVLGSQAAGVPGAVAGYVGGPILDSALASGFTTQLQTAAMLQRLASAIRRGDVSQVARLTAQLRTAGVASAATASESRTPETAPVQLAQ